MPAANPDQCHVLVIDDEEHPRRNRGGNSRRKGLSTAPSPPAARTAPKKIENQEFDLIITDLKMGDLDGLAILKKAKEVQQEAEVMVVTGFGDVKTAVRPSGRRSLTTCSSRSTRMNCWRSWPSRPKT